MRFSGARRGALGILAASATFAFMPQSLARTLPAITVMKNPNCGCCTGWAEHLRKVGFAVTMVDSTDLNSVRTELGVPRDLAGCHTAQMGRYVIEGHVPAAAILRLLDEQPDASGLSVPGMPVGSPGMEGGTPEIYEVVLFSASGRRSYGRYEGDRQI